MKKFSEIKQKSINRLKDCKKIVNEASNFAEVEEWLEKIDRTIDALRDEKLKIVFFGGFSDGKTTILSALLSRSDLRISPEPTTDRVQTYNFEDYLIIDTPGLFSEKTEHDEKTKKYISEADLVIFVTDAMNPLKESQHSTIKWLLKDIGKLDQTIFVINKLDNTGIDIESKEDFEGACSVKKDVVVSTLNEILKAERRDYLTVCLIADPWQMGIKHWLSNKEEYERLSNIKELEGMINRIIEENKYDLITQKVNSVVQDIILNTRGAIEGLIEKMELKVEELENQKAQLQRELETTRDELFESSRRIKDRLDSLRRELISTISGSESIDKLKQSIHEEIGTSEGEILKAKIQDIYESELQNLQNYIEDTQKILEKMVFTYEEMDNLTLEFTSNLKYAAPLKNWLSNISTETIRDTFFRSRRLFKLPIKFRPWGATKKAAKISRAFKTLAFAIDGVTVIANAIEKTQLDKKKAELNNNLNKLFGELMQQTDPKFLKENYLTVLLEYEKMEKSLMEQYESYREQLNNLKKLKVILDKYDEG